MYVNANSQCELAEFIRGDRYALNLGAKDKTGEWWAKTHSPTFFSPEPVHCQLALDANFAHESGVVP